MIEISEMWVSEHVRTLKSMYYYFKDTAGGYNSGIVGKLGYHTPGGYTMFCFEGFTRSNSLVIISDYNAGRGFDELEDLLLFALKLKNGSLVAFDSMQDLMMYHLAGIGHIRDKLEALLEDPQNEDLLRELYGNFKV